MCGNKLVFAQIALSKATLQGGSIASSLLHYFKNVFKFFFGGGQHAIHISRIQVLFCAPDFNNEHPRRSQCMRDYSRSLGDFPLVEAPQKVFLHNKNLKKK